MLVNYTCLLQLHRRQLYHQPKQNMPLWYSISCHKETVDALKANYIETVTGRLPFNAQWMDWKLKSKSSAPSLSLGIIFNFFLSVISLFEASSFLRLLTYQATSRGDRLQWQFPWCDTHCFMWKCYCNDQLLSTGPEWHINSCVRLQDKNDKLNIFVQVAVA